MLKICRPLSHCHLLCASEKHLGLFIRATRRGYSGCFVGFAVHHVVINGGVRRLPERMGRCNYFIHLTT